MTTHARSGDKLIAAAPEMLKILRDIRNDTAPLSVMMASIEEIIAKAEGRS